MAKWRLRRVIGIETAACDIRIAAVNVPTPQATGQAFTDNQLNGQLMMRLEDLLRRKKLRIAPGPLTDALLKELTSLDREIRASGTMVYSTPSAGHHDDLVMATALAAWRAWEMHSRYLQPDSPVSIVSDTGVWWK